MLAKLKTIADLKEELKDLDSKVISIKSDKYTTKATQKLADAFDEFGKYFIENGFKVEKKEMSTSAVYKTEKITLAKSGFRDWLLHLGVNGKEIGSVSIEVTRKTMTSSSRSYTAGGSDDLEREISLLTQQIETAKLDLASVNDLEFCYIIEAPDKKVEFGKEYESFKEVIEKLIN
ncbi:hypothetical protein [Brevibacillus choshinensis]|uniref:hypothetical protein n=1 Tax=Brevibacillus choshinensis TaxID=54911 RepID=UPI002E232FAF|nr:hypothetical protein [Brevibacillus choshinensis]